MSARYLIGDVRDRLREIPDGSVDLIMTSPPFLALRSYLPADHPDKHLEIGSEPTPGEFLDTLLGLTAEWGRVLAPHGSIVVELGDTYSGSGGAGGDYADGGLRDGQPAFDGSARRARKGSGWPRAKSLALIPQLYAVALSYGIHPLTGEPSPAGQWLVRNVVAWCRPNPPVGALGDKFRPATSYLTIATRSPRRYFDLDAVREPYKPAQSGAATTFAAGRRGNEQGRRGSGVADTDYTQGPGAPPLDWWEIPTSPYKGAHYATYPEALCHRPILSMCPQRVCRTCGEPTRREVAYSDEYAAHLNRGREAKAAFRRDCGEKLQNADSKRVNAEYVTTGWSDCGHGSWACSACGGRDPSTPRGDGGLPALRGDVPSQLTWTCQHCGGTSLRYVEDHWRPGVVLDPFAGSGTTLAVAVGHGRHAIGIDLDERNAELARERVGMFLEVDG